MYRRFGTLCSFFNGGVSRKTNQEPRQAKVLTGGRRLEQSASRRPLSVSHSYVWSHSWAL